MIAQTKAIVLHTVRYQEKSLIVKCYTERFGLTSYFIRNAFSKGKNANKIAYFQPLSLLEISGNHKGKNSLEYIADLRLLHPYQTLNTDFNKSTVALFLSELMHHALHEDEPNAALYHFLETAFLWFDSHDFAPDFHLVFMMELTKFLGFYPDDEQDGLYFSPREGSFSNDYQTDAFTIEASAVFKKLLSSRFDLAARFSQSERQLLLDSMLHYFNHHIAEFRSIKSLEILKEIYR